MQRQSNIEESIQVLHVDDDPDFADMTATFLEREDDRFTVELATSAAEGRNRLATSEFDCIVSDYEMPGQNGIEFLQAVREEYPELPFILFTGKGSEEVASDAIAAGVNHYLQKSGGTDQYTLLANRIKQAVERYRAQQTQERHLNAIETAQEGISILNEDGEFIYVNDAYADLYGYEPETMLGEHWELIYPEDEIQRAREEILPRVEKTGSWDGTTTGLRADGSTFVEDHRVTLTEHGELVCTVRNLSEREVTERRLNRYQTLIEALDDPVYALDETGRFEYVNDAFVEMVGYDRERILGSSVELIKDEEAVAQGEANLGRLLSSDGPESCRFEVEIQPKEGSPIPCEDHMGVLPYEGDSFNGSVGMLRDISDRKRRERRLQGQLAQFEQFGDVLSHDLRTPLRTVEGRIELARETGELTHLDQAETAVERLDMLIDDLATVMREGKLADDMVAVDVEECVRDVWEMLPTDGADLRIDETVLIQGDETAVTRMVENLCKNALEHGGDTVTVGVLPDGFYVEDNGPGIPEDIRDEIFELGNTTKSSDEGAGFGLASARQIAVAHGWEITAGESSNGGARFEITDVEFAE